MSSSSGNVNYYSIFNMKLMDFLKDLNGVLGTERDYKVLVASAKLLTQTNERQNAKLFIQFVSKDYGQKILDRDETFFIEHDYQEAMQANSGDVVQLLKGKWKGLAQEDRESIWAHLNGLVLIANRCGAKA